MQRVLSVLVLSILAVAASACDSLDEEDDAERIQGSWNVTSVSDEEGDLSAEFQQFGELTVVFEEDAYAFTAIPADVTFDGITILSGSYTMEPVSNSIVLQATVEGDQTIPIPATYRFDDDDELELTVQEEYLQILINAAAQQDIELAGDVTFRMERTSD